MTLSAEQKLKIRFRNRRGYVKEADRHMEWGEWQIVDGRKVIARFDLEEQAKAYIAKMESQP